MTALDIAPREGLALASGAVGDAYVASLTIEIRGDGTARRLQIDGSTFEDLFTAIEARAQAFELRTRAFRPDGMRAAIVIQRLDRLWSAIDSMAQDNERLIDAAEGMREIAEMSTTITWRLA